jgi:D-glycero-alpha-D-manno-heptose-7-phosphate kinase
MKEVTKTGSVRVDLLGGTIDLHPINMILDDVVTLNLATSLKAKVKIYPVKQKGITIESIDYSNSWHYELSDFSKENLRGDFFGPMKLVANLLGLFTLKDGIKMELSSGAPPGSGLGGSSAMGVTVLKALYDFFDISYVNPNVLKEVMNVEAMVLNCGPTGYQDYYPALYGGVLALIPRLGGILVDQLYNEELAIYLQDHFTLAYSGQGRFSAINNWEIYKRFFDGDESIRQGLQEIARLSREAYKAINIKDFPRLAELIVEEGKTRKDLFPNIVTDEMRACLMKMKTGHSHINIKVCGAGGGGCFLVYHKPEDREYVEQSLNEFGMDVLDFHIAPVEK